MPDYMRSMEMARLRAVNSELRDLVQTLLDNDPNELAADGGITVLDVWREAARRALVK